jgi:HEAT repeat protein
VDAGWDDTTPSEPLPRRSAQRRDTMPFEREGGGEPSSDVGHEAPLAPASRQLALGPLAPFPRQDAKDRLLPSVIVDVDADCRALLARLLEGDESAADPLVQIGPPAVSMLVAALPGPVHPERRGRFAETGLLASDCGPLLKVVSRIGQDAIPFVVVRTADRDPSVRAWATWLLGELPSAESARAVVRRFSDADAEVRRAALAAGRMMQSDPEARTALRDGLATLAADPAQPPEVRHGSMEALADVRDPRAVPRLIPLLTSENASIARSAHRALCTLSRQDFAHDVKAWQLWWQQNQERHRIEWLIDALLHERLDVRRAAGEELKSWTREYFGYYEDLPPKERARAQRAYREWWEARGKARFS